MMQCPVFKLLLLIVPLSSCLQSSQDQQYRALKPNIIYILADDLGYGDIKAINEASGIETPNMDRLVREGTYFTDAHSSSAVCTPTRSGILTGRYAWRSSLKSGVLWGYSPPLIEPERMTVASFLKGNGYRTGVVGKWHLGLGWQPLLPDSPIVQYDWEYLFDAQSGSNVDFSKPVEGGPSTLGFDYSFIFPSSLDMTPYVYLVNDTVVELPTAYTAGKSENKDGRGVFWRAGEISPGLLVEKVLDDLSEKAVTFIHDYGQQEDPFFLYFPLTAPHAPWVPGSQYRGSSEAGLYGDFVTHVDKVVGDILNALDQMQITENTLVLLTSDNGAHWTMGDKEMYEHRPNYHFRGQKADIYEGGHRIPYIVRWPGQIPSGSVCPLLISTTDFFATMAGITGTEPPPGVAEDSYDMADVYLHLTEEPIRNVMIQHSLNGSFAIRQGNWKYSPQLGSGGFTSPAVIDSLGGSLYNLETDPGEAQNLIEERRAKAQRMHQNLELITGQKFHPVL